MVIELKRIKISEHKGKFLIAIIFLIIVIIGVSVFLKTMEKKEIRECLKDSDCVRQRISCCPCNMGGEEKCVTKKESAVLEENLSRCTRIFCSAVYNCIDEKCRCINGVCV